MTMSQILLVEDDYAIGQGTKTYLETVTDHKVTWIDHGEEALAVLSKAHEYDCILLDLTLSGVQGLDILKTLRAHDQATPVIIVTANDFSDVRAVCMQAGATDFLAKPFEPAKVVECVNAFLPDPTNYIATHSWTSRPIEQG